MNLVQISLLKNRFRFKWLLLLAFVFTAMASHAKPPVPWLGVGLEFVKKGSKFQISYIRPGSYADSILWVGKNLQLLQIENKYLGKTLVLEKNTSLEEVYTYLIGPEGSDVVLTLKQKKIKTPLTRAIRHQFVYQKSGYSARYTDPSSPAELNIIRSEHSWNYCENGEKPVYSDDDSLPDSRDKCPLQAGPVRNDGCPFDRDKDGVADDDDKCPDQPGTVASQGCPALDSDEDGITDNLDDCPYVPGYANLGCPQSYCEKPDGWKPRKKTTSDGDSDDEDDEDDEDDDSYDEDFPDLDYDAVCDYYDLCPDTWGLIQYLGCPGKPIMNLKPDFIKTLDQICLASVTDFEDIRGPEIKREGDYILYVSRLKIPGITGPQQVYYSLKDSFYFFAVKMAEGQPYATALQYYAEMCISLNNSTESGRSVLPDYDTSMANFQSSPLQWFSYSKMVERTSEMYGASLKVSMMNDSKGITTFLSVFKNEEE